MHYLSYLIFGPSSVESKVLRDNHPQPTINANRSTHSYLGTITNIAHDRRVQEIDGAVVIDLGVSQTERYDAQSFWLKKNAACYTSSVGFGVGSIGSGIKAFNANNETTASQLGFLAIGLAIGGIWSLYRGVQASSQKNKWKDPMPEFQEMRRLCEKFEKDAFSHILHKNLKNSFVTLKEIQELLPRQIAHYRGLYQANASSAFTSRNDLLARLSKHCPLSFEALQYAYPDNDTPKPLLEGRISYEHFLNEFNGLLSVYRQEKINLRTAANAKLATLNNDQILTSTASHAVQVVYNANTDAQPLDENDGLTPEERESNRRNKKEVVEAVATVAEVATNIYLETQKTEVVNEYNRELNKLKTTQLKSLIEKCDPLVREMFEKSLAQPQKQQPTGWFSSTNSKL